MSSYYTARSQRAISRGAAISSRETELATAAAAAQQRNVSDVQSQRQSFPSFPLNPTQDCGGEGSESGGNVSEPDSGSRRFAGGAAPGRTCEAPCDGQLPWGHNSLRCQLIATWHGKRYFFTLLKKQLPSAGLTSEVRSRSIPRFCTTSVLEISNAGMLECRSCLNAHRIDSKLTLSG